MNFMKMMGVALIMMFIPFFGCSAEKKIEREPAVAGQFYPSNKEKLTEVIKVCLQQAEKKSVAGKLTALLVPHAGYIFSAPTAAYAYKLLEEQKFSTVVIIGLSHRYPLEGAALFPSGGFRTPLGLVPIDEYLNKKLAQASPLIKVIPQAHLSEHSVEVQLPFLQYLWKDFKFVPIVTGNPDLESCQKIGEAIGQAIKDYSGKDKSVLLIASSDMSHYPRGKDAEKVDRGTLSVIEQFDPRKLYTWDNQQLSLGTANLDCVLCGEGAVLITMAAAKVLGADQVTALNYAHSGKVSGDDSQVVGYGAAAFSVSGAGKPAQSKTEIKKEEFSLSVEARKELLSLARNSINYFLKNHRLPSSEIKSAELKKTVAVFVTLRKFGQLRGCIGHTQAHLPLAEAVVQMAVAAAVEDHRFPPVTAEELKDIQIEISALSPLQPIDNPDRIVMGKHGVMVRSNGRSGLFLPQVAEETGWSKEKFLSELCSQKAGLSPQAWKDKQTKLAIFTVFSFEENR